MVILFCLMNLCFTACSTNNELLKDKMDESVISKIQIVTAMGNPEFGSDSKIITDMEEIIAMVRLFNNAVVAKKVDDSDVVIADASYYYIYIDDEEITKFIFNGNDTTRIWFNDTWHYVTYGESSDTPFKLYKDSKAEVMLVDENLNVIARPNE